MGHISQNRFGVVLIFLMQQRVKVPQSKWSFVVLTRASSLAWEGGRGMRETMQVDIDLHGGGGTSEEGNAIQCSKCG